MFTEAVDHRRGLVVWLFSGRENSDADLEAFVRSIGEMSSRSAARPTAAVVVVDPGNPPANAAWRKRIADASATAPAGACFALVTRSVVTRGVLTAIRWIRQPPFPIATHETFEEAVAWVQKQRDVDAPLLRRLMQKARDVADGRDSGLASTPPASGVPSSPSASTPPASGAPSSSPSGSIPPVSRVLGPSRRRSAG